MTNQQLWQAVLGSLEVSLSKANFNTWFKNTLIIERGADYILIGVPSAFNRDWIAAKYHHEILKSLKALAPEIKEIKYQLGAQSQFSPPGATKKRSRRKTFASHPERSETTGAPQGLCAYQPTGIFSEIRL